MSSKATCASTRAIAADAVRSVRWKYERGLHDLGNGAYAWLAPDVATLFGRMAELGGF